MVAQKINLLSWLAVWLFSSLTAFSQPVSWSFEQIDSVQKLEKRPVFVFIHTDWCRFCQVMKNQTFRDDEVIELLNSSFYFVDFNAEEERDIGFNGRLFRYNPTGLSTGIHELAEQLGTIDGKIAYPAVCILNSEYEITFQSSQFIEPKVLTKILRVLIEKF